MPTRTAPPEAQVLLDEIRRFIEPFAASGDCKAVRPGNRVKFHWPPHPVSYEYHVLATEWTGHASFQAHEETFEVRVARTPFGVFGRCDSLWHEARGDSQEEMLVSLRETSEPLFQRQLAVNRTLQRPGRFTDHISELNPGDLLKLLYCEDRDVAREAREAIEGRARSHIFLPSLLAILADRAHPFRRSAQWCVLDLFEDLPSFASDELENRAAVRAMRDLIWDAEDDYARTIYKAGVVLGGHLPTEFGGPTLLECLQAPSPIGRRAAIHGLFHVVEWSPEMQAQVVGALRDVGVRDVNPLLRTYANEMAHDIENSNMDHVTEPKFPEEAQ